MYCPECLTNCDKPYPPYDTNCLDCVTPTIPISYKLLEMKTTPSHNVNRPNALPKMSNNLPVIQLSTKILDCVTPDIVDA